MEATADNFQLVFAAQLHEVYGIAGTAEQLMTKAYNYKDIMEALTMIQEHPQDVLKIVLKFEDR